MLLYQLMKFLSRNIIIGILLGAVMLLSFTPKSAIAATVLGNYTSINDASRTGIGGGSLKAIVFEVPAGNNYALNSYTARLNGLSSVTYIANLYATDGTTRGALITTVGTTVVTTPSVNHFMDGIFTPSSPITLTAGQRYWLELDRVSGDIDSGWAASTPNVAPTGIFTSLGYKLSTNGGINWINSTLNNNFALDADEIIPPTATPTDTATPTFTNTPTDTPTPTDTTTPIPPTSTATPTDTPIPPTSTATPTDTVTPPIPPTSTATPILATPTPTLPVCIYGLPPNGVQGRVLIDVMAFYNPSLEATTNILVQGGSSWWIIDARNGFYKLWISCEGQPIWVLANTVAPNFDHVWNGAELPDAGE